MKKIFLVLNLLFSLISTVCFAQSLKVVTKDGQVYYGEGKLPEIHSEEINLKTEDKQNITIESIDVLYLLAWHPDKDSTYAYELIYSRYLDMSKSELSKNYAWMVYIYGSEFLSLYTTAHTYGINRDGGFVFTSVHGAYKDLGALVRKPIEPVPTMVIYTPGGLTADNRFRTSFLYAEYFDDCPELVQRIKSKEFKKTTLKEVVHLYDQCVE
jgi:hypothetical protein